ncbi:DUF1223 domain-containing protein [Micromonospora sp. ALFpr18c]|uniref:DUF1223 domain-containing protein n=1 Tax=unclassified Micromonospora TaxID=2617518 RepID=UPI00124B51B2|nr:DUF1223 domain-containing protein [Micromonospora sp. ALFpr18c]KAB1940175.1 DUF1223 domain-containing protein [Micromonospora sp. ALFpr18c]
MTDPSTGFAVVGLFTSQARVARAFGPGRLYTPQMIVNGTAEFVGSDRRRAADTIASVLTSAATTPLALPVRNRDGGRRVEVDYQAERR